MSTASRTAGAVLVLVSCCAVQGSAAVSSALFDDLGPTAVAAWRQAAGALVLVLLLRPGVRGRTARRWGGIAVLAVAMASMNVAFYQAVDRLPLGVAATLLYLGPFAVAASTVRRGPALLLPVVALAGVGLVSRPTGGVSPSGVALGLLAAYTLASQDVGRDSGLDSLALAVLGSAVLLSPAAAASAASVAPSQWLVLAASGGVGVGVAFACDYVALQLSGARVVATLFALDPAVGAVLGAVLLAEELTAAVVLGMALVVLTGAVTVATSTPRGVS